MKKSALITAMILCVLLCACGPGGDGEPDDGSSPPDSVVTGGPDTPPSGGVSANPPDVAPAYVPYETVCSLSAPEEAYRPEVAVFPLVNTPVIYKDCVDGPVLFADPDGGFVPLPDGVTRYYALHQYEFDGDMNLSRIPQCVMLMDENQKLAVMLLDGTMTTGFDYDLYFHFDGGEDYPYFSIREGYLIVGINDGGMYRFGLLDVRAGALVIPCEYGYMELCRGGVYAERGGESMLLDYTGRMAVSFGNRAKNDGVVYMDYPDAGLAGLPGDSFVIVDGVSGTDVYRTRHAADVLLYALDGLNLMAENAHQANSKITVTDDGGEVLFAARGDFPPNFWVGENGFVVKHNGMLTAITKRGERSDFLYDAGEDYLHDVQYQDGRIRASFMVDYYTEELRIISPDGSYTAQQSEVNTQTGCFRYRDNDGVPETAYADDQGNILIPFGQYEEFTELDSDNRVFLLAAVQLGTSPDAVYGRDGTLLADGLFGVVDELFTPERLVVYLAPDECGFLSSDGTFTPIKNVPVMNKVHYGG